jgi:hypothetical protein
MPIPLLCLHWTFSDNESKQCRFFVWLTLHNWTPNCTTFTHWTESESHITTDGQSASLSWNKAPIWAYDQIVISARNTEYVWQLRSWFRGAPSLMRERVCLLYVLLALASAVFLGSETLGTRDHILLSQIWDFPFRRLLRLAGSRWRYSTPSPHRTRSFELYSLGTDPQRTPPASPILLLRAGIT